MEKSIADKIRKKKFEHNESRDKEGCVHCGHPDPFGIEASVKGEEGPGTNVKPNFSAKEYTAGDRSQLKEQPNNSNLKGQKLPKMHERIDMIRKRLRK